jgi:hypothetical protein
VILLSIAVALGTFESACGSGTTASASGFSACPPQSGMSRRYLVSGVVTDDAGVAMPDAEVVIDYVGTEPSSRFIGTRTDRDGRYAVTFCTDAREFRGMKGAVGVVSAYSRGHRPGNQPLAGNAGEIVQNLRLDTAPPVR